MENQSEIKWYQKPTSIILLLIFFFPIGLYLMWKKEYGQKKSSLGLKYILIYMFGLGSFLLVFFINLIDSPMESKPQIQPESTQVEPSSSPETEPSQSLPSEPIEPSESEKKIMCLRMFGGGDMSAWETAQAECMLNNSQSACDCMQILSK